MRCASIRCARPVLLLTVGLLLGLLAGLLPSAAAAATAGASPAYVVQAGSADRAAALVVGAGARSTASSR